MNNAKSTEDMKTFRQLLLYFLMLISAHTYAQNQTQVYSFGGKDLEVKSDYDCSQKFTLVSPDFAIANVKIPKFIYNSNDIEELNEEFGQEFAKEITDDEITILQERKISFKSFGQKFEGYLYQTLVKEKTQFMISSFGEIENAIYLMIFLKDEALDFNKMVFPAELNKLIQITDLN